MQHPAWIFLGLLLAPFLATRPVLGAQIASSRSISRALPIQRVIDLLKGLSEKIELEAKEEEALYYKFVCWAKSIVEQKTAYVADSEARIHELTKYIADIEAGRVEFTTERVDLEKDIATLSEDIEVATGIREKEKDDFENAKTEMKKAIAALSSAIDVLSTATQDHKDGVFLRVRSKLGVVEHAATRAAEAASLANAVELGNKFLSPGDAVFLQRLLGAEVPNWSWKKLNRKATFKMSYKARSFRIQDVLGKLLETFATNLNDATTKENEAQETFDKLMESKNSELDSAKEALLKLEKEGGVAGLSKEQAQDELDGLTTNVADDKKYIQQVQDSLDTKKSEYKARKTLRSDELAAISKALAVLLSDESRDTFKKSFASQGYTLLQVSANSEFRHRRLTAAAVLRQTAARAPDRRLTFLAARLSSENEFRSAPAPAPAGHFDEVVQAIDNMLDILKQEEESDRKQVEDCNTDRAEDTRSAIVASREMDENTDTMNRLESEIKEIRAEVAKKEERVKELDGELADAKQVRADEHKAYQASKKDDQAAYDLVIQSMDILKDFYKNNNLGDVSAVLLAKGKKQPQTALGEAPPPPPSTWDKPEYGGKVQASKGVVAIMHMISEDIKDDIAKADKEESDSNSMYQKTKTALNKEKGEMQSSINSLNQNAGNKVIESEGTKGERSLKGDSVENLLKKIEGAEPGCNFFTINYEARRQNRHVEMDGLVKAKTILQGASYNPADEGRELKPGDAL